MIPIVNGLEEEFSGQVPVVRLDAAKPENLQLMQTYGVRGHPTFVVIDSRNRITQRFFGPQSETVLRTAIRDILP